LWDFTVVTDRCVTASHPDLILVLKQSHNALLVDFACPADYNIKRKEIEKVTKYKDLVLEIQRLWNVKAKVIPIVIGALLLNLMIGWRNCPSKCNLTYTKVCIVEYCWDTSQNIEHLWTLVRFWCLYVFWCTSLNCLNCNKNHNNNTNTEWKEGLSSDVAIPGDSRLCSKVLEKQTKYTDLKIEVQKLWNISCQIVPIVVGTLGSIPKSLTECLATINLQVALVRTIQKSVLLSSVHLIRRYLSVDSYCACFCKGLKPQLHVVTV